MSHPVIKKAVPFFAAIVLCATVLAQNTVNWQTQIGNKKVFIENQSQFDGKNNLSGSTILFGTENGPSQIFFTKQGLTYSLVKKTPKYNKEKEAKEHGEKKNIAEREREEHEVTITKDVVQMQWENANPNVKVVAVEKSTGYQTFVVHGKSVVAQCYKKLVYQNLYPGIDVEYTFHPTVGIEYSFIVHPGADIHQIKMKYSDVSKLSADEKGNLHLPTKFGDIVDHAPVTYYEGNKNSGLASTFIKSGKTISFDVEPYDNTKTIVIDPWTVNPPMPNSNKVFHIQSDSNGNAYMYGGDSPFVLEKYNSSGVYQWTFNSGVDSSTTWMGSLITDPAGNSIITGGTPPIITKVNTSGTQVWTNTGGSLDEYWNLAFNCDYTQLVVGGTRLTGFPAPNGSGRIYNINPNSGAVISNVLLGYALHYSVFGLPTEDPNEVRALSSSPNGNYYFLTLDTVGSIKPNLAINYETLSTYRYAYGSPNYGFTPQGQSTLRATGTDLYSMDGANVHKRSIGTGAIVATAAIPGGAVVTSGLVPGSAAKNGGIAIDSCGNVYVGSQTQVVKYDANLNQLSTAATPSAVYDIAITTNGNILASGNGFAININMSACAPIQPICVTIFTAAATAQSPQCPGSCNGSASASTINGTGPFTYSWTGGQTTATATNLCPGNYTVTITDNSNSATSTASVTIATPGAFTATASNTSSSCGGSTGTATATVTAGTGPYTYSWSNNGTAQTINNLPAGNYTVTVTGNGGCSTTASTSVTSTGGLSVTPSSAGTTCGLTNGTAGVTVTGTGSFTYSWSNNSTAASLTNLVPGTYNVTVSGTGGCSATASVLVDTSSALTISAFGGRAGCTSSGTATVNVSTGTGPFTYSWSNGGTASSINSLSAGNYSVTVTGAANCSASTTVTVISTGTGVTLSSSANPSTCGTSTGSASVNALTGNTPFTYSWSNGGTAAAINNVGSGTYVVTVTANGGCSATASVDVTSTGTLTVTTSAHGTTCGSSNGSASVNAGTGSFTYSWSNNATTDTISNVAAGTYTVTVQGSPGCSATASATVNPSGGAITITAPSSAVCQGDTEQVCAPAGYQTYHWNTGASTQCVTASAAGSFAVTVTDNANCTATSNQITITVNVADSVSITQSGNTLIAGAAATYQWYFNGAPIAGATSSTYVPTQDGNYYVKTTDQNGCPYTTRTEVVKGILGINELTAGSIVKVYPNPLANGNWHLDVSADWIGSTCEIYDAAGRLVFKTEVKAIQSEFELNVAQGIYMMRINSAQKNYAVKLIKF